MKLSDALVTELRSMVGGHPALLQQAFSELKNNPEKTIEQVLETAPTEVGIYRNYLRQLLSSLQEHSDLLEAFKQVLMANDSLRLSSKITYQLESLGLVKLQGNDCLTRFNLYRQYFSH